MREQTWALSGFYESVDILDPPVLSDVLCDLDLLDSEENNERHEYSFLIVQLWGLLSYWW